MAKSTKIIKRVTQSKAKLDVCSIDCSLSTYNTELMKVLNELNLIDNKEKIKWIPTKNQAFLKDLDIITVRSYCTFFKLKSMGAILSKEHEDFFSDIVKKVETTKKKKKENVDVKVEIKEKKSIQDYIKDKADIISSVIDGALDEILLKGKTEVTVEELMSMEEFSQQSLKYIKENYKLNLEEFKSLELGNDEYIKEAYDYKGKDLTKFKKMVKFIRELLTNLEIKVKNTAIKTTRRRVFKSIPPTKQVEKLVFNNDDLGANKGIHPANIIGANFIIAYDKVKKTLLEIVGDNIQVKGKSLINIDIEKCKTYKIKKPDVFFNTNISNIGKRAIASLTSTIDNKHLKTNRLNDNIIFLKVIK